MFKLGNLCFGGKVVSQIVIKDWNTKEDKILYTIELPCGIYISTYDKIHD